MRDNKVSPKPFFFASPERREVFPAKTKEKITRKESREHLARFNLACELVKVIRHFFPELLSLLKRVEDPRHQSYIIYSNHVLLMTRILSSIFYINSMRSTSGEFNDETVIENIGVLCGEELRELPYWETINNYLKRFSSDELQKVVCRLVYRLIRSRAFEDARLRGKYWQIIIDGTQLYRSRKDLGGTQPVLWKEDDYVTGIDYRRESINVIEYEREEEKKKFLYVTDLSITGRNVKETVERGRWRWKIENEGFNTQKKQGYYLEHRFSHDYQGMKNHYYVIQIGHMIAQIIEACERLWKKVKQSRTQKHRLLLNAWKNRRIKENESELEKKIQVRFACS